MYELYFFKVHFHIFKLIYSFQSEEKKMLFDDTYACTTLRHVMMFFGVATYAARTTL